jgi:nucleoside-diphosphate-sugar epimerase
MYAGFIGTELTRNLRSRGIYTLEVRNRRQLDLRDPMCLQSYPFTAATNTDKPNVRVSHMYFLACEVGGFKFLESSGDNTQLDILRNNLQMYQHLFQWAATNNVTVIFTSSYMR